MIDWDKGLPLDILAKIGGGCDGMKVMREISSFWQMGFGLGVSKLTISAADGPFLPKESSAADQFPALTSLNLGGCSSAAENMADLLHLEGFKSLESLSLGHADGKTSCNTHHQPLCSALDSETLRSLLDVVIDNNLPVITLHLNCCVRLTDQGLARLGGLPPLRYLDLHACRALTDKGLQYLEVGFFCHPTGFLYRVIAALSVQSG